MTRDTVREGILVGLVGAATIAVWFFIYDLAAGVPFRTPALLGQVLFGGLRDPAAASIAAGPVIAYTIFHGAAFIAFGLIMATLFTLAARERTVLFAAFMLLCCFEVVAILVAMVFAERVLDEISPWSILGGNLIASALMLTILLRRYHRMPREVLTAGE